MTQVTVHNPNSLELIDIKNLHPLQGDYKFLKASEYTKLHNSILKHGFSFPIKVWTSEKGIHFIIGGHQRLKVLKKSFTSSLVIDYINTENGIVETNRVSYDTVKVPVEFVRADNKKEAIKLLLLDDSRFGETNANNSFIKEAYELGVDLSGINIHDLSIDIGEAEKLMSTKLNEEDLGLMLNQKQAELDEYLDSNTNDIENIKQKNNSNANINIGMDMGFNKNEDRIRDKSSSITITVPTKYLESIEKKLSEIPIISIGNEKEQVKRGRRLIKLFLNIDDTSL